MVQYFPVVTGSLTVTGSINVSGGITASGGISISGSIASASFASTASFVALAQSASNAVAAATASFANAFTVAGNLTAQTLVVQTITSSVDFVTGSTRFGSLLTNTHVFSGSVTMNPNGLFVSSSGLVGVGTTALVSDALLPLQINAVATTGQAYFASNNAGGYGLLMGYDNVNGYARIRNVSNTALTFETNNAERMRITSSGLVAIGTTSPATFLHVNGATAALPNGSGTTQSAGNRIRLSTAAGTGILDIGCAGGTGMWLQSTDLTDLNLKYPILLNPNGGNVGIGTGAPDYKLDVNGVTQIRDTLLTTKQVGFNYSQTSTSGTTSLVNTGIFYNTSITGFSNNGTYLLVVTGNPNALGSNEYRAVYLGYITINTGYDFGITNVVQRISYTQIVAADAFNIGTLTISAVFWNGTTETTQQVNGTTNNQIRIKITGYNSSAIGAAQEVRLTKIVG